MALKPKNLGSGKNRKELLLRGGRLLAQICYFVIMMKVENLL
jgi:hypothetical protein